MIVDKEKIREIVAEVLCLEPDEIGEDADFVSELGVNSVQMLEIVAGIEDEFDIEISASDLGKYDSIRKIVKALEEIGKL